MSGRIRPFLVLDRPRQRGARTRDLAGRGWTSRLRPAHRHRPWAPRAARHQSVGIRLRAGHEGEGGDLLALMAGSVVGSFAEANRDTADTASGARLRVLRGRLASGVTQGRVSQLVFPWSCRPSTTSTRCSRASVTRMGATAQPAVARAAADARPGPPDPFRARRFRRTLDGCSRPERRRVERRGAATSGGRVRA